MPVHTEEEKGRRTEETNCFGNKLYNERLLRKVVALDSPPLTQQVFSLGANRTIIADSRDKDIFLLIFTYAYTIEEDSC